MALADIKVDEGYNLREFHISNGADKALVADIQTNGLLSPLVVEGDILRDGHRRYYACLEAGLQDVPVNEYTGPLSDLGRLAFIYSINSGVELTPLEQGDGFIRMVEDFGQPIKEIAALTTKSGQHVRNCIFIAQMKDEVRVAVGNGKLKVGVLVDLFADPKFKGWKKEVKAYRTWYKNWWTKDANEPPEADPEPETPLWDALTAKALKLASQDAKRKPKLSASEQEELDLLRAEVKGYRAKAVAKLEKYSNFTAKQEGEKGAPTYSQLVTALKEAHDLLTGGQATTAKAKKKLGWEDAAASE